MAEDRPWLFTDISSLHPETQVYTARRRNAESPAERKYTLNTLADYLMSYFGFTRKYGAGTYANDAAAAAAGVPVGGLYELSISNEYGIPVGNGGVLKIRKS